MWTFKEFWWFYGNIVWTWEVSHRITKMEHFPIQKIVIEFLMELRVHKSSSFFFWYLE